MGWGLRHRLHSTISRTFWPLNSFSPPALASASWSTLSLAAAYGLLSLFQAHPSIERKVIFFSAIHALIFSGATKWPTLLALLIGRSMGQRRISLKRPSSVTGVQRPTPNSLHILQSALSHVTNSVRWSRNRIWVCNHSYRMGMFDPKYGCQYWNQDQ